VVVNGDRKDALRLLLPDNVLRQNAADLFGFRHGGAVHDLVIPAAFAAHDLVAQLDALETDPAVHPEYEFLYLFARLPAKSASRVVTIQSASGQKNLPAW
jgi:hypothetical protein